MISIQINGKFLIISFLLLVITQAAIQVPVLVLISPKTEINSSFETYFTQAVINAESQYSHKFKISLTTVLLSSESDLNDAISTHIPLMVLDATYLTSLTFQISKLAKVTPFIHFY